MMNQAVELWIENQHLNVLFLFHFRIPGERFIQLCENIVFPLLPLSISFGFLNVTLSFHKEKENRHPQFLWNLGSGYA